MKSSINPKMEPLNVEVETSKLNPQTAEAPLHELIDIALKTGRIIFFGASYSIERSMSEEFTVKNWRSKQIFHRILHCVFWLYMTIPFFCENLTLSPCSLVNYIKKGVHLSLLFCVATSFYILEIKGCRSGIDGMIGIYTQCDLLQKRFNAMGLHFPSRRKIQTLGWSVAIGACVTCILRQTLFATSENNEIWYKRHVRHFAETISLGFWIPGENELDAILPFGAFGMIIDALVINFWYYCQAVNFYFILIVWMVFQRLNAAVKSGLFTEKNLAEVIDLHFHSTKLLNLVNEYLSLLTFSSTLITTIGLCFWTNYIAADGQLRMHHVAALSFFLKATFKLLLEADVNSKAHKITEWLEHCCSQTDTFPSIDPFKFGIFTSQVYNKDCTGLRGLNFFVVTPRLAMAVAGIVMTYTVAVNQLCHS